MAVWPLNSLFTLGWPYMKTFGLLMDNNLRTKCRNAHPYLV